MPEKDQKGPSVTWVFRKPLSGYFSIEGVFDAIQPEIEKKTRLSRWVAPFPGVGLMPRVKNLLAVRKLSSRIIHVTGDAHYLALCIPRKNLILTIHDCGFLYHPNPLARWLLRLFWLDIPVRRASAVTVISASTYQEVARATGAAHKLRIIPNPVNPAFHPSPLPAPESGVRVLQIGTKENKNLFRVADALAGLDLTLVILGKPTEAQVARLQSRGIRFEWQTGLETQAVADLYRSCHFLLFASTYEGFGLPVIEAQASGRPVITSAIEPMRTVAGPEGALFVDPLNPDEIRAAVCRLMSDNRLAGDLVSAGNKNVEKYKAEAIAGAYFDVYVETGMHAS